MTAKQPTQKKPPPQPRGRPRKLHGGRRINVYLDQESLDRAEILGEGNLSLGVRRALKIED